MQLFIKDTNDTWMLKTRGEETLRNLNVLLDEIKLLLAKADDSVGCIVFDDDDEERLDALLFSILEGDLGDGLLCSVLNASVANYLFRPLEECECRVKITFKRQSSETVHPFSREELFQKTEEELRNDPLVLVFDATLPF